MTTYTPSAEQDNLIGNLRTINTNAKLLNSTDRVKLAETILSSFSGYILAHPRPSLSSFFRSFGSDFGRAWLDTVEQRENARGRTGSVEFIQEVLQYAIETYDALKGKKEGINDNSRLHFLLTRLATVNVSAITKALETAAKPSAEASTLRL